jgi:hypothetical protein
MEIFQRYLQAVKFLLPRSQQDDIVKELREDIRSQMEDKEAELGRPLDEIGQAAILKQYGHPLIVASRYRQPPFQYLIGPVLFPFYWFVLKMLLWITLGVCVLNSIALLSSGEPIRHLLNGVLVFAHAALPAFGWVTLLFAVLDFLEAKFRLLDRLNRRWDPRSLPSLTKRTQVRRSESIFGLVAGTVYTIWLLAAPYHPYLLFGPAASFLRLTPVWHRFYIPVVVLALSSLVQSAVNLARPDWTWLRAATRLVSNVVVLLILRSILNKTYPFVTAIANKTYPFVTAIADQGTTGAHYQTLAATVIICMALALAGTGIGLCIGLIPNAWSCLSELRRFFRSRAATASHIF